MTFHKQQEGKEKQQYREIIPLSGVEPLTGTKAAHLPVIGVRPSGCRAATGRGREQHTIRTTDLGQGRRTGGVPTATTSFGTKAAAAPPFGKRRNNRKHKSGVIRPPGPVPKPIGESFVF